MDFKGDHTDGGMCPFGPEMGRQCLREQIFRDFQVLEICNECKKERYGALAFKTV